MSDFLPRLIRALPIFFGLFFLGPLIAELMGLAGVTPASFGLALSPLIFGMGLGGLYGVFAWASGRWI